MNIFSNIISTIIIIVAIAFSNSVKLLGQTCSVPIINTQQQIDNFSTDYPGCTQISGDLIIKGSNVLNLNGLSTIGYVSGRLEISYTPNLSSIQGLSNLFYIGGEMKIRNTGFSSLSDLIIEDIGGSLIITENDNLISLTGLELLETIPSHLSIKYNNNLSSLSGLNYVTSILGNVYIDNNPSLISISDFPDVQTLPGDLLITNNQVLSSLNGLDALVSIGHDLNISNNNTLVTLTGLHNLETIGFSIPNAASLDINSNNNLLEIDLNNLISIANPNYGYYGNLHLKIIANTSLTTIGLNNLSTIGGSGVANGRLEINYNPSLMKISGLNSLEKIFNFEINGNDNLELIDGFQSLYEALYLEIQNSDNLTSLIGLSSLTQSNRIRLEENASLITLDGLEFLNVAEININYNAILSDISALKDNQATISELSINGNNSLSICNIESICDALDLGIPTLSIGNNKVGCNNTQEVEDRCDGIYPIAQGTINQCVTVSSIDISSSSNNNNEFLPILDNQGNILCMINANGNDLGLTHFDVYVSSVDRTSSNNIPYMRRNITVNPTNQPSWNTNVRFYYTQNEYNALLIADPSINNYSDIDFTKSEISCSNAFGGVGNFIPQSSSGTYGSNGDIFIESSFSSFSSIFANGQNTSLPVVWSHPLQIQRINESTTLNWSVSQQINNDKFIIEHSINGKEFDFIGEIKGEANYIQEKDYQFVHKKPTQGANYYRIKQVDKDGKYDYSNIAYSSILEKGNIKTIIYPIPVTDIITVDSPIENNLHIYNQFGIMMSKNIIIVGKNEINLSKYVSGIYLFKTDTGEVWRVVKK